MLEGVEDMALLYTRVDGNLNFQVTQMTYQQVQEDPYAALLERRGPFVHKLMSQPLHTASSAC